jgi:hypothetical protein
MEKVKYISSFSILISDLQDNSTKIIALSQNIDDDICEPDAELNFNTLAMEFKIVKALSQIDEF